MYYNVDICKKAGLLDASGKLKPLVGPAAVLNAFKAAQKVTGKYGLATRLRGCDALAHLLHPLFAARRHGGLARREERGPR